MRPGFTVQIAAMTTTLLVLSLISVGVGVGHYAEHILKLIADSSAGSVDAAAKAAHVAFLTQEIMRAKQTIFGIAGVALLVSAALSFFLARGIASPLRRLTNAVSCLSRHDYSFSLSDLADRSDEIGQLAHCAESVRQITETKDKLEKEQGQLLDLTKTGKKELENVMLFQLEGIVEASVDCSQAVIIALKLMQSVRKSASMTQNIATAIEELVASVQTISENAGTAATESKEANDATSQGVNASTKARSAVETLTITISEAGNKVRALSEATTQIGDVVGQIEAIAAQTNLLALNATIEAARAGEAGKGFAIVASEVKQLANQVARATDGIRKQIENLRVEMDSALQSMNSSINAAEQGKEAVDHVTGQLDTIAHKVQTVSSGMQNIAEILAQQTQAANEVSTSTVQISKASETSKEEVNSTLEKLNKTTKLLDTRVDSFAEKMGADAIIEVAKSDHIRLLRRITERLADANDLSPDKFPDHKSCRFGRWYFSVQDPAVKNHTSFQKIDDPHKKFHESGRRVLEHYLAARHEEALEEMNVATELSKEMLRYLDELSQFVKQERAKKENVA